MSSKSLIKIGVAFGLLAAVLIVLGVNYVPRIFASSAQSDFSFTVSQSHILHSHYHNSQVQRAITSQLSFAGTDSLVSHLQAIALHRSFAGTDALLSHRQAIALQRSFVGTDALVSHLQAIASQVSFTGTDALLSRLSPVQ